MEWLSAEQILELLEVNTAGNGTADPRALSIIAGLETLETRPSGGE